MAKRLPGPDHVPHARNGSCEIQDLFRLFGKSHTLDILHLFVVQEHDHTLRFVEVQRALDLSPNTLSERLRELTQAGLLARATRNEIPPRVDYQATRKARDLEPVFEELSRWSKRHDLQPEAPPSEAATG